MRHNCFLYWKYHCTSGAVPSAPFLNWRSMVWEEDPDKYVAQYILWRKSKGAPSFICQFVFEILLCAIMLKRFHYIESFHSVSGNDTRTVQWAVAAAEGTTAEWRRQQTTREEIKVGLKCSCRCSLVGIGNIQFSERHLHRKKCKTRNGHTRNGQIQV